MIFLARNAAEDVKLSLMYTLGWLGLKDSQGVRFVAAARAQLSCIVRSEHYSCSPWAPLAALTTARLAAEFSIEERSSQSEPPLRDSLASQSGPGITGSDQSEAPSLLSPGSRGRPARARALLSLLAPVAGEYPFVKKHTISLEAILPAYSGFILHILSSVLLKVTPLHPRSSHQ